MSNEAPIFEYGTMDNGMSCIIFTMVPYRNVAITMGSVQVYQDGYKANYIIARNPTDIDLYTDPGFHRYMSRIIKQVLRKNENINFEMVS